LARMVICSVLLWQPGSCADEVRQRRFPSAMKSMTKAKPRVKQN
jgi:hypothetical protein